MSAPGLEAAVPAAAAPAAWRAAPFGLRVAALVAMGAIFFSTYGFANWLASRHASVPSFAFGWERAIPFLPWTIVPYWSIDLLYGFSFAFQTNCAALAGHLKRLLFVQLVSVACFIAWPLRFGFERPEAGGLAGALFTALAGFDQPYNQAPSLHIGLLVVLWAAYAARWREPWQRVLLHPWFAAIGVSVLTTYQHHAVDVPTGAAVGCLALFLFPLEPAAGAHADAMHATPATPASPRARRIGARYAVAALLAAAVALACIPGAVPAALLAGWIALALAGTAFAYLSGAPAAFQKRADGRMPLPVALLLAPTIAGAFVNSRIWTRRAPQPVEIAPRVQVGRTPTTRELERGGADAVLDLSAEMPRWLRLGAATGPAYRAVPQLDLVVPSIAALTRAVETLDGFHRDGRRVLVCCALGYGRSVLCAAAWLATQEPALDARAALERIRALQPHAVCSDEAVECVQRWLDARTTGGA